VTATTAQLEQRVAKLEKQLHDLHIEELGKSQKDAFPQVLEAWVQQAALAKLSRRRLAILVGIAALAGPIAEVLLRVLPPVAH
jgi:hypothetical protein